MKFLLNKRGLMEQAYLVSPCRCSASLATVTSRRVAAARKNTRLGERGENQPGQTFPLATYLPPFCETVCSVCREIRGGDRAQPKCNVLLT